MPSKASPLGFQERPLTSPDSKVVVVPPSGSWDGNDGLWSTFNIELGTPPQPLRVLVNTTFGQVQAIARNVTEGNCQVPNALDCPLARGGLFSTLNSTSWNGTNIPSDPAIPSTGFDTLTITSAKLAPVELASQQALTWSSNDIFLGSIGLFPTYNSPEPFGTGTLTILASLQSSNHIDSLSYGYTAGAWYRNKTGSLTLGGYDTSKFSDLGISVPMSSRQMMLPLALVVFHGNNQEKTLLSTKLSAAIDSGQSEIWLPEDSCSLFQEAFDLLYDPTLNRYLVNDTTHRHLSSTNPSVSFSLQNSTLEGAAAGIVNVTLPYGSFDLRLGPPYTKQAVNYFPLRRTTNTSGPTLGRTFLQEAYIIADYERDTFWVQQNSRGSVGSPKLLGISAKAGRHVSPSRNVGAIVGGVIAAAAIIIIIIIIITILLIYLRRRKRKKGPQKENMTSGIDEKGGDEVYNKPEMDGSGRIQGELHGSSSLPQADDQSRPEMQNNSIYEVQGQCRRHLAELDGFSAARVELGSDKELPELPIHP